MPVQKLPRQIAVDGPAGAGKTSVGRELARRLGYRFLDTGLMYRAVTWAALEQQIPLDDREALVALARDPDLRAEFDASGETRVFLRDREITPELHSRAVDDIVSMVSTHPEIRRALVERQRALAAEAPIVMAGRDIGTVVLQNAALKIYLTASPEERARRRYEELRQSGTDVTSDAVLESMQQRDELDSTRAASPLRPAVEAKVIHTDGEPLEGVVCAIQRLLGLEGARA